MNTPRIIALCVLWLALTCGLAGEERPPAQEELLALEKFLTLSDAELDAMQEAIARVRAMSPQQRVDFAKRIVAFRELPSDERRQIQAGWGWASNEDRRDWRQMMHSIDSETRAEIHAELEALAPSKRAQFKHEILQEWRSAADSGN